MRLWPPEVDGVVRGVVEPGDGLVGKVEATGELGLRRFELMQEE